ncbi:MAG: class IIb bacteriocin, lactobin A/cerein 7B family [Nostoc sp.]|uniref:class IIb bacteriocin, lactobin A/cerein 7B family n=1 Tax=Nostoc sp. TaxID=1180 RepID=UPI002FFA1986
MATIKINNLNAAGSDLLNDSESYLNALTDEEINMTNGGFTPILIVYGCAVLATALSAYAYKVSRR